MIKQKKIEFTLYQCGGEFNYQNAPRRAGKTENSKAVFIRSVVFEDPIESLEYQSLGQDISIYFRHEGGFYMLELSKDEYLTALEKRGSEIQRRGDYIHVCNSLEEIDEESDCYDDDEWQEVFTDVDDLRDVAEYYILLSYLGEEVDAIKEV